MRVAVLSAALVALASAGAADVPPSPSPTPRPAPVRAGERKPHPANSPAPASAASPAAPAIPTTRAASPKPGEKKVYTNTDLPAEPSPAVIASPGPAGAGRGTVNQLPETANVAPVSREDSLAMKNEAHWRELARQRRVDVETQVNRIAELEQRIAELRTDRGVDNLMDPNREQTRAAKIGEAQAEVERARADLERAKQAVTDLAEQARRENIPPGWLEPQ